MWQKTILLGTVEAMDLIDKEQSALPHCPSFSGAFKDFTQIRNTGKNGRKRFEMKISYIGQ